MLRSRTHSFRCLISSVTFTALTSVALTGCHFEAHMSTGDDAKKKEAKKAHKANEIEAAKADDDANKPVKKPAKKEAADKKDPAAEAAPAKEPAAVEVNKDAVLLPGNLVFEPGKATLKEGSGSEDVLASLKAFLDQQPRVTLLRIEGHSDNTESASDSLKLSGDRAVTIKQWLMAKGVADTRLLAVGFGTQKPIADNSSEAGRAQNRRVEFKIAKTNGKNYLGNDPLGGGTEFK